MKKIIIKNIKKELEDLGATSTQIEMIINNVSLYNDMIIEYLSGEKTNEYLLYQINIAINKQLMEIRKLNAKNSNTKKTKTFFEDNFENE